MAEILQGPEGRQVSYGAGKRFKCAFCGGTGVQPRSLKSRCFPCRGKGEVEFDRQVVKCLSCRGKGTASGSQTLPCIQCGGIGVVEKNEEGGDPEGKQASYGAGAADIIGERLGEITKRLKRTRKKAEKKTKEIEKRLKPVKSFIKEVFARGGSPSSVAELLRRTGALGGKKETLKYSKLTSGQALWFKKLGNNLKKAWESLLKQ